MRFSREKKKKKIKIKKNSGRIYRKIRVRSRVRGNNVITINRFASLLTGAPGERQVFRNESFGKAPTDKIEPSV